MHAPDLDAIRARIRDSVIWLFHPTVNPCACGECNPTAHPEHPRYADLKALRADIDALLAEVERLRMHGAHECPACGFDHTYVAVRDWAQAKLADVVREIERMQQITAIRPDAPMPDRTPAPTLALLTDIEGDHIDDPPKAR